MVEHSIRSELLRVFAPGQVVLAVLVLLPVRPVGPKRLAFFISDFRRSPSVTDGRRTMGLVAAETLDSEPWLMGGAWSVGCLIGAPLGQVVAGDSHDELLALVGCRETRHHLVAPLTALRWHHGATAVPHHLLELCGVKRVDTASEIGVQKTDRRGTRGR